MANSISKVKKLLKQKHGDMVTIDETTYINMTSKARFIDRELGEWWAKVAGVVNCGYRHPKRGKLTQGRKRYTVEYVQKLLNRRHNGQVLIIPETFTKAAAKARFMDIEYGEWEAEVRSVIRGHGHPIRGYYLSNVRKIKPLQTVIEELKETHGDTITIKPESYKNFAKNAVFLDKEYGEWQATPKNVIYNGTKHPSRKGDPTKQEKLISERLGIQRFNKLFLGYKPDFKLSETVYLNCDGVYWHSSKMEPDNRYHFNLRKKFEENGLRIIQILETDIHRKTDIVLSMLNQVTGNTPIKLNARDLEIKKLSASNTENFYNTNHLMGSKRGTTTYGLVDKDGTVYAAMSYCIKKAVLKIERFCNKLNTSVRGGQSKLLKFIETLNKGSFTEVHYWVDLRYGSGKHLLNQGFTIKRETIGFRWTDFKNTYNRLYCRARNGESEASIAKAKGLYRIYDAGQRLYVKTVQL